MKNTLFLILTCLICFSACGDDFVPTERDCHTKVDYEAFEKLEEACREAKFDTKEKIEEKLLGEWKLIGIKSGWIDTIYHDCLMLEIDENQITVTDIESGETSSSEWSVEPWEVGSRKGFYLITGETYDPSSTAPYKGNRIGMEVFSENCMFGTARTDDGDNYLYERVR